jgi:hypothetical protein
MRKAVVLVGSIALGIFLVFIVRARFDPLRQSNAVITQNLEKITPLGISYEKAAELLTKRFARVDKNEKTGFFLQEITHHEVVGVRSIEVHLGDYFQAPLGRTSVDAFWGFDSNGRLMKIWVWKTTYSL